MPKTHMTKPEVLEVLPDGWHYIVASKCISKDFERKNFLDAVAFVNEIAPMAEKADHHPDVMIHDYKNVEVLLSTHSEGGVTKKDIFLANMINEL